MEQVHFLGSTSPSRWRSWLVTLHWAVVDGRVECVGIEVRPAAEPDADSAYRTVEATVRPVTTSGVLRALPLGELIDRKRREARKQLEASIDEAGREPVPEGPLQDRAFFSPERVAAARRRARQIAARDDLKAFEAAERGRGGRARYGPEHLEDVAAVYSDADSKPTATVARRWGVSKSAAAKWVQRAREQGLLPRTTRGRARGGPGRKGR